MEVMTAITIRNNESPFISVILQEDAARARSTGFGGGGGGGVYGVPPTGRKVPDGWQKTGAEISMNRSRILPKLRNIANTLYS